MALYGTILRIFDESTLVVSIGAADGLKRGDTVVVIERAEEIKDPATGESLGVLELVKAELVAADVQDRISILKTARGGEAAVNLPLSTRMVRDSIGEEQRSVMAVAPGAMSGLPSVSPVKIGDTVRRVER
jgi:hypothetical protein